MNLSLDPAKHAQEVLFSGNTMEANHPLLIFKGDHVAQTDVKIFRY